MPATGVSRVKALKQPTTKAADKRWGAPELRTLLATMRVHLMANKTDLAIQEEMSLDTGDYNALKSELYEQEKTDINDKSVEDVFIAFGHRMEGCINDLDEIIKDKKGTNPNAVVGAVRAKADIINKIIDRGQEFGLIEKVPERKVVVAGLLVSKLDTKQLRKLISKQVGELGQIMDKYGDATMTELDPAPPPALPPASPEEEAKPSPAAKATVTFGPLGKQGKAIGGIAKAAGGKATAHKKASEPTSPSSG